MSFYPILGQMLQISQLDPKKHPFIFCIKQKMCRSQNHQIRSHPTQKSTIFFCLQGEAIGYGKSPEWVEVDGMIVSRGGTSIHMVSALNSLHDSATSRSNNKTNSVYSSRTLLTYDSSTQRSSGRSTTDNETLDRGPRFRKPIPTPDEMEYESSEPPYETIPSVPPNINNFTITTQAVVNKNEDKIDESVISAHDTLHSGIYNIVSGSAKTAASAVNYNNVEYLRKKLLMQDANETRL